MSTARQEELKQLVASLIYWRRKWFESQVPGKIEDKQANHKASKAERLIRERFGGVNINELIG